MVRAGARLWQERGLGWGKSVGGGAPIPVAPQCTRPLPPPARWMQRTGSWQGAPAHLVHATGSGPWRTNGDRQGKYSSGSGHCEESGAQRQVYPLPSQSPNAQHQSHWVPLSAGAPTPVLKPASKLRHVQCCVLFLVPARGQRRLPPPLLLAPPHPLPLLPCPPCSPPLPSSPALLPCPPFTTHRVPGLMQHPSPRSVGAGGPAANNEGRCPRRGTPAPTGTAAVRVIPQHGAWAVRGAGLGRGGGASVGTWSSGSSTCKPHTQPTHCGLKVLLEEGVSPMQRVAQRAN